MRKLIILFFIVLAVTAFGQSGEKNFIDVNYIEVTGKGEIQVVPDLIYIKIGLNEKDYKNKTELDVKEQAMVNKLKEIGIDVEKDLFVNDMSSNFTNYFLSKGEILLSKEYQVIAHDTKTTSKIFVELEKLDISNISIDKLDNTEIEKYKKEVKIDAIKAAKEKASFLLQAIDQEIGRAIYVQEFTRNFDSGFTGIANSIRIRGLASLNTSKAKEIDIDFEKIKLEYSILCRFEIKN